MKLDFNSSMQLSCVFVFLIKRTSVEEKDSEPTVDTPAEEAQEAAIPAEAVKAAIPTKELPSTEGSLCLLCDSLHCIT